MAAYRPECPTAVAIAELDGDGMPDLAVANSGAASMSVLLGTGNGAFRPAIDYLLPPSARPLSLAVTDVDGDRALDLVVANNTIGTVSVLHGDGDGGFPIRADYQIGAAPFALAVTDASGDGLSDIVVADSLIMQLGFALGDAAHPGAFLTPVAYPTGRDARGLTVTDVNSDHKHDLITVNQSSQSVSVLLGNGDGTFQTKRDASTAFGPAVTAAADFDRDGKLRVALDGVAAFEHVANHLLAGLIERCADHRGDHRTARYERKKRT
jgi:hypothetical protein